MRLPNCLRERRGTRTLREIAFDSGVSLSEISRIERGQLLPRDEQIHDLERAYDLPFPEWWLSPYATTAMERDEHAA